MLFLVNTFYFTSSSFAVSNNTLTSVQFQNTFYTTDYSSLHLIALLRWFMASLVIRFFSSLLPSNQCSNVNCNIVTKVHKIAKTAGELYYDVTVKFSPVLIETSGQITAKQQNIKLEFGLH